MFNKGGCISLNEYLTLHDNHEIYTEEEINQYTNEELIKLIRETNDNRYWDLLWIKTKGIIINVYQNKVSSFYKQNRQDEITGLLTEAWLYAVKKYDEEKATDEFHAFAIFIIRQRYFRYIQRFNSVKESRSVFMNLIEDIAIDNGEDNSQELIDKILVDHNTCNDFDNILIKEEARIYLDQLKEYDEFIYKLVVESVINETTKKDLAKKYNMTPGQISRRINKGINMIRENIKNNN